MKTLIYLGLILFIGGVQSNSYAFRMEKPIPITEINPTTLVELNRTLEQIWEILCGRYNLNVTSTVPKGDATEGDARLYYSGDLYKLYVFLNGSWRSFDANDFDLVDSSDNNILDSSGNQIIVY